MLPYCGRSLLSGIIRDLQVCSHASFSCIAACIKSTLLAHRCLALNRWCWHVQAREYLYFKVFGSQETTPIAIMTSAAKGNHQRVQKLLADNNWFGRGKDSFRHAALPSLRPFIFLTFDHSNLNLHLMVVL